MFELLLSIFIVSFIIIVWATIIGVLIAWYVRRVRTIRASEPQFEGERIEIQLLAAFIGLKPLPTIALVRQNYNPKLFFLPGGIEFKVISKKYKQYSEIESVDILTWRQTRNITFNFRDSIFNFSGNVIVDKVLTDALAFLEKKGVPLTPKARSFLAQANSQS